MPKPKKEDNKLHEIPTEYVYISSYIDKKKENIIEQVYCAGKNLLAVYNTLSGEVSYHEEVELNEDGIKYIRPIEGEEIEKKAILLPSGIEEYETEEKLDEEIKTFINKWLDIPQDILQFAVWNIKRSWVFERFHTLNYLRALGDTGQGKTRFIDTLGAIHYKTINTSGATTSAPIFRIINKWRGTLVIDEADFKDSDESHDIIKIINMGYEKGKFVMRCDKDDNDKVNFFDPYCPKVIATRKSFDDKATESRCITHVMCGTTRTDIPPNLNDTFFEESRHLRNKLLLWRFRNYFKIDPEKIIVFDYGDVEPRMRQIITGLINLFGDSPDQLAKFRAFIKTKQEELVEERKNSFAGQVVSALCDLMNEGNENISVSDIIHKGEIKDFKGNLIQPRGLSKTLRELGFPKTIDKRVGGEVKKVLELKEAHISLLFKRYGCHKLNIQTELCSDVTVVTVVGESMPMVTKVDTNVNQYTKEDKFKKFGSHVVNGYNGYTVTTISTHLGTFTKTNPIFKKCSFCQNTPEMGLVWQKEGYSNFEYMICDDCLELHKL